MAAACLAGAARRAGAGVGLAAAALGGGPFFSSSKMLSEASFVVGVEMMNGRGLKPASIAARYSLCFACNIYFFSSFQPLSPDKIAGRTLLTVVKPTKAGMFDRAPVMSNLPLF